MLTGLWRGDQPHSSDRTGKTQSGADRPVARWPTPQLRPCRQDTVRCRQVRGTATSHTAALTVHVIKTRSGVEDSVAQRTDLVKTGVLHMVGGHLLLPLDLHTDVKTNSTRHCRLVRPLFWRKKNPHHQHSALTLVEGSGGGDLLML